VVLLWSATSFQVWSWSEQLPFPEGKTRLILGVDKREERHAQHSRLPFPLAFQVISVVEACKLHIEANY
jgi:hypothetical protein